MDETLVPTDPYHKLLFAVALKAVIEQDPSNVKDISCSSKYKNRKQSLENRRQDVSRAARRFVNSIADTLLGSKIATLTPAEAVTVYFNLLPAIGRKRNVR